MKRSVLIRAAALAVVLLGTESTVAQPPQTGPNTARCADAGVQVVAATAVSIAATTAFAATHPRLADARDTVDTAGAAVVAAKSDLATNPENPDKIAALIRAQETLQVAIITFLNAIGPTVDAELTTAIADALGGLESAGAARDTACIPVEEVTPPPSPPDADTGGVMVGGAADLPDPCAAS